MASSGGMRISGESSRTSRRDEHRSSAFPRQHFPGTERPTNGLPYDREEPDGSKWRPTPLRLAVYLWIEKRVKRAENSLHSSFLSFHF